MYKKNMFIGLFIFLSINLLNGMEDGAFTGNPYVVREGWNPTAASPRPSSQTLKKELPFNVGNPRRSARLSQVMPEVLPQICVAQAVEEISRYYKLRHSTLNLDEKSIGCKLSWDDIKNHLYPAFLRYDQERVSRGENPIEVLNFTNNNLSIKSFPMQILLHMIQSPSLKKICLAGNPEMLTFDPEDYELGSAFRDLVEGYSSYLDITKSRGKRFAENFISGIIEQGEVRLEITLAEPELVPGRDTIVFDLGEGIRPIKIQKKIVNIPKNLLRRLTPLFSKLGVIGFVYGLTTLGTYFFSQPDTYTGECSAEYIYYLLSSCGLNATQFLELAS